jgi:hypothetical protein
MCEHHACFHEFAAARSSAASQRSLQYASGDNTSVSIYSISQTSQHQKSQHGQGSAAVETHNIGQVGRLAALTSTTRPTSDSQLPDTAQSGRRSRGESTFPGLPPLPPECLLPSDVSSGSLDSTSRASQWYQNISLSSNDVLLHPNGSNPDPNAVALALVCHPLASDVQLHGHTFQDEQVVQSATEVNTPSPRGSPILGSDDRFIRSADNFHAHSSGMAASEQDSLSRHIQGSSGRAAAAFTTGVAVHLDTTIHRQVQYDVERQQLSSLQSITKNSTVPPTLDTIVQHHEHRIDLLENASGSYAGVQEVQEKFDLVDERMGEVETRVEELEKSQAALNDMTNSSFRRLLQNADNGSVISDTASERISAAIDRTEIFGRLETVESQVAQVQPSYKNPWVAEVVFLPFGTDMKGIWFTHHDFPSQRSQRNSLVDDQTQQSRFERARSVGHRTWEDLHWRHGKENKTMVARACGRGSKVEERLRSRGLVKTMVVRGPHFRDVDFAIREAFGGLPGILPSHHEEADYHIPTDLARFDGLHSPWIPFRKLHKDSKLQFLDPSELVTPAVWTASFLSSVAMRATGNHRLFLTQREGYIQSSHSQDEHWTWAKLRILPRVTLDPESGHEVLEGDANEPCWEWDSRLDPPQSVHTSFSSHHSLLSIRQGSSHRENSPASHQSASSSSIPSRSATLTPANERRPLSPLIAKLRPTHFRNNSMPSMIPTKFSPPNKRRIGSFDQLPAPARPSTSPQSSPVQQTATYTIANTKRQRMTRSPSRPRDFYGFAPQPENLEVKRGTTPFAYATPHSNAPYTAMSHPMDFDDDDVGGDTDVVDTTEEDQDMTEQDSDADVGFGQHGNAYDVWEGVEDNDMDEDGSGTDQEQRALSPQEMDESDDDDEDDAASAVSSQPSEYPSTQPGAKGTGTGGGFDIYMDEE